MTKKIKFINIIIMSIMVIMFQTPIFANETTVKTSINQVDEDNRIKVEVSIQTLENIGEGINAYSGILKFNSKELNLIDIKSEGIWNTPVYNKETIETGEVKVVATTNQFIKKEDQLFVAIFEKKQEKSSYSLELTNFEVAAKINDKTVKIEEKLQKEENIVQEQVKNTEKEKNNNEVQGWGKILGIAVASALLLIGILSLGFGLYRKNKGGK